MKKSLHIIALVAFTFGFAYSQKPNVEELTASVHSQITVSQLQAQLEEISNESFMPCHAIGFPLNLSFAETVRSNKSYFWKISAPEMGIKAFLTINALPLYDTLFVLNSAGKRVEFLTHDNYLQTKWSSLIVNDALTLQYKSLDGGKPAIRIRSYNLSIPEKKAEDFGDSDACEINVNCSEGASYQDIKNSVVRIYIKVDQAYFWCTGSLVNNTSFDHTPYLLTAEHCALNGPTFADSSDIADWEFFFKYESPNCSSPSSEGNLANNKITGAVMRANSNDDGGNTGSDFLLLELDLSFNNGIFPASFQPYFAGWNRKDAAPSSGVCIHHPQGDIKKISTSSSPAVSSEYGNTVFDTHWEVVWSQTANGHGVTEGGSSGSPYINSSNLIVGTLTGGYANCTNNTGEDFYGKFSYHWDQNGSTPNRRLKDWLDPLNLNPTELTGASLSDSAPPFDKDLLSIAPNPARLGKLYINGLFEVGSKTIQIYNLQGNLVYPTTPDRPAIDLVEKGYFPIDNLPNGPYVLRVIENSDVKAIKFIKLD